MLMRPDASAFRACLGRFATGVTVVTYERDGAPRGTTVSCFASVSLDPPLVLVGIRSSARAGAALPKQPFTVNVLSSQQRDHALHFSGQPRTDLRLDWEHVGNRPRLADCMAYVSCQPWATHPAGDHLLVIGEVDDLEVCSDDPLVFYGGDFRSLEQVLAQKYDEAASSGAVR